MVRARALTRRTEPGRHYGALTAKHLAVLGALLWGFHNCATGRCFPSYEAIADRAACARSTVYEAIRALEQAGVLSWVNRLIRVRERCADLFGNDGWKIRVIRTSNAYSFIDPAAKMAPCQNLLRTLPANASGGSPRSDGCNKVGKPAGFVRVTVARN